MKNIFCVWLIIPLLFFMIVLPVHAGQKLQCGGNGPDRLLQSKIKQILSVLEDRTLSDTQKAERLQGIVDPIFNYRLMAKLTLGRKYWPGLTKKEQAEFSDLFVKRLKASYFDKISLYSGNVHADVVCRGVEPAGKKAVVPVTVSAKGTTIDMRYYFYRFPAGWQVYDVEINGVSIVSSYKAQFDQVLSHGTIEDLLSALKKPVKTTEKPYEKLPPESDTSDQ